MIKLHYFVALVALSVAGTIAQADPIDPVMSMDDPTAGTPVPLGFSFSANAVGGGFLAFNNASGVLWTTLDIFVTLPTNSPITCISGPFFNSCTSSSTNSGGGNALYDIRFSNVEEISIAPQQLSGIAPDVFFTLNLNNLINGVQPVDPSAIGGWGAGNSFDAVANGAPEPASWLLLVVGAALLVVFRERSHRRAV